LLTDMKIKTEEDALSAMQKLHSLGVGTVILSSAEFGGSGSNSGNDGAGTRLSALASDGRSGRAYRILIPQLPAAFVGTGDLFTALVTAWLRRRCSLPEALERTICSMQAVLTRTLAAAKVAVAADGKGGSKPSAQHMELKLIQSKADIENPVVTIKAEEIKRL